MDDSVFQHAVSRFTANIRYHWYLLFWSRLIFNIYWNYSLVIFNKRSKKFRKDIAVLLSMDVQGCQCRHLPFDWKLFSLQWRHNGRDSVSNHQPHDCLLNRLFRRKSKKTSKLRATGLCAGKSPGTGEFPAQMASYAENVSIWWRHHVSSSW